VLIITLLLFPKGKVFLQKLNYALGVTEIVFLEFIDLVEGSLKGVVCELASLGVILEHLVVKYGVVQS